MYKINNIRTEAIIFPVALAFIIINSFCVLANPPDLEFYPEIFIDDGSLDAVIVIGDEADPGDVIGAIDIGTGLQYAMKQGKSIALDLAIRDMEGAFRIDRPGNHYTPGLDSLADVYERIGENELPVILAEETYEDDEGETSNSNRYRQILRFIDDSESGVAKLHQPDGRDSGPYVLFDSSDLIYDYSLEFDDPVEYTNSSASGQRPSDDLEDTLLTIQGRDYTITYVGDAGASGGYRINKLTLLSGDSILWLQQGKTLNRIIEGTEHEIEVMDVNDDEDMCGVSVDGDILWISKGSSREINGITIGLAEAVAVHSELQDTDICRLSLGASELTLEDGNEVEIDGMDVSGSRVYFQGIAGEWKGFNISYEPEDDIYLSEEEEMLDPVFQSFKMVHGGVNYIIESIQIETDGDDEAEILLDNNDGRKAAIPLYMNGSAVLFGEDDDEQLLMEGDICNKTSVKECEGSLIFAVTTGEELHILEIRDIDTSKDKIDIYDRTYSRDHDDEDYTDSTTAPSVLYLSGIGNIQMIIDETNGIVNITDSVLDQPAETGKGATFTLDTEGENATFHLLEETDDETSDYVTNISIKLYPDLANEEIDIERPKDELVLYRNSIIAMTAGLYAGQGIPGGLPEAFYAANMANGTFGSTFQQIYDIRSLLLKAGWHDISEGNSDTIRSATIYSTDVLYDDEDKQWVIMNYPDNELTDDFFIAPHYSELEIIEEKERYVLDEIDSGTAKLASEMDGMEKSRNIISIGGPCVNSVSAELMGLDFPACGKESTIRPDTGILRLYENNGNLGLVAAGYDVLGTRAASRVLAEHDEYFMSGNDLEAVYTDLDDISVREAEEYVIDVEAAEPEELKPEIECAGTNPASKTNEVRTGKLGLSIESSTNHIIRMHGLNGEVTFIPDKVFRAQLGVDWLRIAYHILKGECSDPGEEVHTDTVEWQDGQKERTSHITVPERGCYCFRIRNEDMVIDSASIEMIGQDEFTIDFST
ncbi:hypothetical protein GF345_05835 [Candidatus Woesearchaeota archaeon]|nr:hypothetical protein [Candidatus Woesearchaeota archaeon]